MKFLLRAREDRLDVFSHIWCMRSLLITSPLSFLPPVDDLEIAVRSAQKDGVSISAVLMKKAQLVLYPPSLIASSHTARDVRLSTQG